MTSVTSSTCGSTAEALTDVVVVELPQRHVRRRDEIDLEIIGDCIDLIALLYGYSEEERTKYGSRGQPSATVASR